MTVVRAFAIVLLLSSAAVAHDGYPPDCCNEGDCKAVPCGEIKRIGAQHWRHRGVQFFANNLRQPRDAQCHVCKWGPTGRCIFFPLPPSS